MMVRYKMGPIENTAKSTLTDITNQAIHALNNPSFHFEAHPSGSVGLPIAAAFGFMPGLIFIPIAIIGSR
jgi:hypothetical protein